MTQFSQSQITLSYEEAEEPPFQLIDHQLHIQASGKNLQEVITHYVEQLNQP